ncbi:MAG TPA: helix-turn-helix transcriptional regulator [Stellaceae bacterium]|nr:helix-turn-helix transcriptional regulator [Stellaceae bacterium]
MTDTVTISRAEYEALLAELDELRDLGAARKAEARVAAGDSEYLPIEMVERLATDHPLRVWRDHRGLSGVQLAAAAGVPQSYISEIETGRKPGSIDAYRRLAEALRVTIDDIAPG